MRTVPYVLLILGVLLAGCGTGASVGPGEPAADRSTATSTDTEETTATEEPTVPPLHPSVDGYPESVLTLTGPETTERIAVKVADTPARRQHGLMEVEELPVGTGMLFVFEEDHRGGFWMKNTLVPLSIAFVDTEGELLAILEMEPCEEDPCPVYDPEVAYRYALEVPQGWFAETGVTEDWALERPLPAPSG